MTDDETNELRYYVALLVRIWTALSLIRKEQSTEMIRIYRDLCSDKLRIMLHEFSNKKDWTLHFAHPGNDRYQRFFSKLCLANNWFEGNGKKPLHYRNCAGAHMQPLGRADHMFQHFGYGGEREWRRLTQGVAACLGMMRILDDNQFSQLWLEIRAKVKGTTNIFDFKTTLDGKEVLLDIPVEIAALIQSYKINDPS